MKKSLLTLCILCILALIQNTKERKTNIFHTNPEDNELGEIIFNSTSNLKEIKINSKSISLLSVDNLLLKNTPKKIYIKLKINDIVTFVFDNDSNANHMFIASLFFKNNENIKNKVTSGDNWICNNKQSRVIKRYAYSNWQLLNDIDSEAEFIWVDSDCKIVECSIVVYQPALKSDIKYFSSNKLINLKINSKDLDIDLHKSNVLDTTHNFSPYLTTGDEIEFVFETDRENILNPQYFIASIKYIDYNGNWKVISTDENWNLDNKTKPKVLTEEYINICKNCNNEFNNSSKFIWSSKPIETNSILFMIKLEDTLEIKTNMNKNEKSVIFVSVDEYLANISINDIPIEINREYESSYLETRSFIVDLKLGDIITITTLKGSATKPAIISSIIFKSNFGKHKIISTNKNDWKCNNLTPMEVEKPEVCNAIVSKKAKWIWYDSKDSKTDKPNIITCKITIE